MKKMIALLLVALAIAPAAMAQLQLPRPSQKASVMQTVGLTDVTITYSRPGVKGRVIWGGLVPYDQVWRTGANEATTFAVTKDVKINGQALPAGTYSLHTIPGKDQWTLIFNKDAGQWGSFSYDQAKDALRIQVKPVEGPMQEWMMFSIPEVTPSSARVELAWEKLRVPFTVETDTNAQAMKNIQDAIAKMSDWRTPYSAANYLISSGGDKAQAVKWLDQSIALKETYWNLRTRASLLADEGKMKEAVAMGEKAVKLGRANKDEASEVDKTEKQVAEWKAGAKK